MFYLCKRDNRLSLISGIYDNQLLEEREPIPVGFMTNLSGSYQDGDRMRVCCWLVTSHSGKSSKDMVDTG